MDHNAILLIVTGLVIAYFHFMLHSSLKKLKLNIETNFENLIQKAVKEEIKNLDLIPKSDVGCNHTYELLEKLQVDNDGDHVGNVYVSRCTKCGNIHKESVYVNS